MPGIAAHFALAEELERRLGFCNNAFVYGCVLPDFIATRGPDGAEFQINASTGRRPRRIYVPDPHYRKPSTYCYVPDLDRFWQETELTGALQLGYAAHLLEDWYFLEQFCPQMQIANLSFFTEDKIYEDYSRLNQLLIKRFKLNLDRMNRVLVQDFFYIPVNKKNYWRNVDWINADYSERLRPRYINPERFFDFIRNVAVLVLANQRFQQLACECGIGSQYFNVVGASITE